MKNENVDILGLNLSQIFELHKNKIFFCWNVK